MKYVTHPKILLTWPGYPHWCVQGNLQKTFQRYINNFNISMLKNVCATFNFLTTFNSNIIDIGNGFWHQYIEVEPSK